MRRTQHRVALDDVLVPRSVQRLSAGAAMALRSLSLHDAYIASRLKCVSSSQE